MQHLYAALYGTGGAVGSWGRGHHWHCCGLNVLRILNAICICHFVFNINIAHSSSLTHSLSLCLCFSRTAEGAFKKLKPEPNSGLSTVSAGITSPGSGLSSLSQHAGHTPTTASCPTPARRRHRTTFTQVSTPPPLEPLLRHLFKHPSLPLSSWSSACARSEKF